MKDSSASVATIPLKSIEDLRAAFPGHSRSFEITMTTADPWPALGLLAAEFARAGLALKNLRVSGTGVIACTVVDAGGAGDLAGLAARLEASASLSVTGWTTVIGM